MADVHTTPTDTQVELGTRLAAPTSPFDDPNADLVLCSADGVEFRVMKGILYHSSPVFRDMLSLPQVDSNVDGHNKTVSEDGLHVVSLSEKSRTLDALLRVCYPIVSPEIRELKLIDEVLGAGLKYDMDVVIHHMRRALQAPEFSNGDKAVEVFVIACRHKLEEEARKAAKDTLKGAYLGDLPFRPALEQLPVRAYHSLLAYYRLAQTSVLQLFTVSSYDILPRVLHEFVTCPNCTSGSGALELRGEDGVHLRIAAWWREFRTRGKKRALNVPLDDDLFAWPFISTLFQQADKCGSCRPNFPTRWNEILPPLIVKRDFLIAEVQIDLSWL